MARYHFDVFGQEIRHRDEIGDEFDSFEQAQQMARSLLLDVARHDGPVVEGYRLICTLRSADPRREWSTSLSITGEAVEGAPDEP